MISVSYQIIADKKTPVQQQYRKMDEKKKKKTTPEKTKRERLSYTVLFIGFSDHHLYATPYHPIPTSI